MIEESLHVESLFGFEHEIDRAAQLVGKDPEGLALVVTVLQLADIILGLMGVPEHEDGCLLDSPFKVMVADFLVGMSGPFPIGLFDGFDQPGIG